jgi:hypothetical protein
VVGSYSIVGVLTPRMRLSADKATECHQNSGGLDREGVMWAPLMSHSENFMS